MKRSFWKRMLPMLVVLAGLLCVSAAAADLSGSCGESNGTGVLDDNVTWAYDAATATLTISGSGDMKQFFHTNPDYADEWNPLQPWYEVREEIRTVVVEEGVTVVSGHAFANCTALESVSLPQSLTMMWSGVFESCTSLREITLPKNLAGMDDSCFLGCTALERITVEEGNAVYWDEDGVLFENLQNGGKRLYAYPAGKEGTSYTVPEGVTETYLSFAFAKLEEIIFPASIKKLTCYDFAFCENLKTLRFLGAAPRVIQDENGFVAAPEGMTIYAKASEPSWVEDAAYDAAASTWYDIPIVLEEKASVDVRIAITVPVGAGVHLDYQSSTSTTGQVFLHVPAYDTYDLQVKKIGCLTHTITGIEVMGEDIDLGTVTLLAGDVDGNDLINARDINGFRREFGKSGEAIGNIAADMNGDGNVNARDINVLRKNFGKSAVKDCTVSYSA